MHGLKKTAYLGLAISAVVLGGVSAVVVAVAAAKRQPRPRQLNSSPSNRSASGMVFLLSMKRSCPLRL